MSHIEGDEVHAIQIPNDSDAAELEESSPPGLSSPVSPAADAGSAVDYAHLPPRHVSRPGSSFANNNPEPSTESKQRRKLSIFDVVQMTNMKVNAESLGASSARGQASARPARLTTHASDSQPPLETQGSTSNLQRTITHSGVRTTPRLGLGVSDDPDKPRKPKSANLLKMTHAARAVMNNIKQEKEKDHNRSFDKSVDMDMDVNAAVPDEPTEVKGMWAPNTTFLIGWSYLIMSFAIYNVITVSYRMAFWSDHTVDITPDVISLLCIDSISDICFFVEIYLNFHTGFVDNGSVIFDKQRIREKYMKGWFWLDVVTCIPFDLIQIAYNNIVPSVRAPKILRLFQVLHHWNHVEENSTVSLQFRLLKLLFYTGVISHFAACIKYHVLLQISNVTTSVNDLLSDRPVFGRYLQSLYWAAGSVTGRDDTTAPDSFSDVGFTTAMMLIGVLWFAYIIASLEQFTDTSNSANARFQAKLKYVQQFMHQFNLPLELQDKVKSYYSYLWSSTLRFETEHFLKSLPIALSTDLRLSLNSEVLSRAAIFSDVEAGFLAYVVHHLTPIVTIPQEIIATVGHAGSEMYFIQEGEVEILIGPKLAAIATLRQGDYFGEYCIFVSKVRTSTARSVNYSTLLVLTQTHLLKAMDLFPQSEKLIKQHVADHRARTLQQERNFLGLDANNQQGQGGRAANTKLRKLIHVDTLTLIQTKSKWTISPQDKYYICWNYFNIAFTMWNAIVVPLRFGFMPTTVSPFILTIDYLGDVFLLADIALNFRVRYLEKGAEISDVGLITKRYLHGWFSLHVISSLPLDFLMIPCLSSACAYTTNTSMSACAHNIHVYIVCVRWHGANCSSQSCSAHLSHAFQHFQPHQG